MRRECDCSEDRCHLCRKPGATRTVRRDDVDHKVHADCEAGVRKLFQFIDRMNGES